MPISCCALLLFLAIIFVILPGSHSAAAVQCNANNTLSSTSVNGTLVCTCKPGWVGPLCQFACPIANGTVCASRGQCYLARRGGVLSAACNCTYPGAVGNCETGCDMAIINGTVNGTLCSGHGVCVGPNLQQCSCVGRFTGITCAECISGWVGNSCSKKCAGPEGPNGTWISCYGHGICQSVNGTPTCTCDPRYVGSDCRRARDQVGILDPLSLLSGRYLKFIVGTVVANSSFTMKLAGFLSNRLLSDPPIRVKISQTFGQCWGGETVYEVSNANKTVNMQAPAVSGTYSVCAKWRTDFEVIVATTGIPQQLVVVAPNANVSFNGYPSCEQYLSFSNQSDMCGCFILGPSPGAAKVSNQLDLRNIINAANASSVYTGCCSPYSPQITRGVSSLRQTWGVCNVTAEAASPWPLPPWSLQ